MNTEMKADKAAGHKWKYCNVTKKKAKGFEEARKAAASESVVAERRRLYDELGAGSEEYLSQTIPAMKKRAQG